MLSDLAGGGLCEWWLVLWKIMWVVVTSMENNVGGG